MINIYILTYNNYKLLKICVQSIINRTKFPYNLIIVDNNSTDEELLNYFSYLKNHKNINIHFNKNNLWVLGLNPALKKYQDGKSEYFVVTDADIVVPTIQNGRCWLEQLVYEMNINQVIGKLGISLDLGYIKSRNNFKNTYLREDGYCSNPQIGQNFIAGVDTTLAIYRHDFFMHKNPRFFPGHAMMNRPYYYTCRTRKNLNCKHMGWRSYSNPKLQNIKDQKSKVICFTLMGAYLDPAFIGDLPFLLRAFYVIFRPLSRGVWAIHLLTYQFLWFIKSTPSKLNQIQYQVKK